MVHSVFSSFRAIANRVEFLRGYRRFQRVQKNSSRFGMKWKERYPILNERSSSTYFDPHYIYHPAWAARILAITDPALHIDISSSLSFCTIVSAFVPVKFYDYRPVNVNLTGLQAKHGDLMCLPFDDNSVESLSCMHVIEHIGLGRYGDALDPDGDLKAIAELKRVLAVNGTLLLVVPVGKPKIRYNAHRIYSYGQIASYFSDFQVKQFAMVNDSGEFSINARPGDADRQNYGCGCWWFAK
jgi:hypothetical protein